MTIAATATTPTDAPPEPPGWLPLRDGQLACAACGVAVDGPFAPGDIVLASVLGMNPYEMRLTKCSTCAAIRDSAVDLLRAHPAERQRIGSYSVALHRLELALGALDAVGIRDAKTIDRLTATGVGLRRLVEHMAVPGGSARWVSRFSPTPTRGLRPESAARGRWVHLTDDHRQELRDAAGALMRARTEQPVAVLAPPDEDGRPQGCLLCGAGSVLALPSKADEQWVEMSVDPATVGGREAPEDIFGVVCSPCDRAIDWAHGVGQTAMTRSVLQYIGAKQYSRTATEITGLVGWGALRDATPNTEPWAHVDLSAVREQLQ